VTELMVPVEGGDPIRFECEDTFVSRWINHEILVGRTYPYLPFVEDVRVIFDVGANCGATTVYLARHYPDAEIHSFEPATGPRSYLERNVATLPNVHVHPLGLAAADGEVPLYFGADDSITGSVYRRETNADESELVALRAAGPWVRSHGIDRIDVLKVDVEGAEADVISSLHELLPTVKALYLEYDSRAARRDLEALVEPTHELYVGVMYLDQGECIYLRRDVADDPRARERPGELVRDPAAGR
jgi:FkbM family methyltransferase